mmetsp:Transcript_35757/g.88005  ORF Transcript_35757/g.88005 Transcript_35757/m.88005 type:complete len:306 (+) Transcript_35757:1693-2610(+)
MPVAFLVDAGWQTPGARALDGERFHQVIRLEVQVVDGGVRSEGVVADAEVGVAGLRGHVQRGEQRGRDDALGQPLGDARAQQHVAVLDGADVDEHHGGRVGRQRGRRVVLAAVQAHAPRLEAEQDLLLVRLGEVELAAVELLAHLVHGELGGALLGGAAFVELCHEPVLARDNLGLTRRDVVAEEPGGEAVLPAREEQAVEGGDVLDVPAVAVTAGVGGALVVGAGVVAVAVVVDVGDNGGVEGAEGPHALHAAHAGRDRVRQRRETRLGALADARHGGGLGVLRVVQLVDAHHRRHLVDSQHCS